MPRPHKGVRTAITLRVPVGLMAMMDARQLVDRNDFIVRAIVEKMQRDASLAELLLSVPVPEGYRG